MQVNIQIIIQIVTYYWLYNAKYILAFGMEA